MNIIIILLIFCVVLFFYLHIYFHLKTSNDMEIYEIETPPKNKIEEICNMRQPVVFPYNNEELMQLCNKDNIQKSQGAFDVKVRNVNRMLEDDEQMYIPIAFNNAIKAINNDNESKYIIENNNDFLEETGMLKKYKEYDEYLRPALVSNCLYDFMMGSNGAKTFFKYEVNYRNYFYVTEGKVKIKLAPPKSSKYLSEVKDYENFEFRSQINPWNVQEKYKMDFEKVNCLDITINKGGLIFIPAYWWYSIEFSENTTLCCLKYRSYMNTISILPRLFINILQLQNTKHKTLPQIKYDNEIKENNDDDDDNDSDNK